MSGEARVLSHLVGPLRDREWHTCAQLAARGLFPSREAARTCLTRRRADLVRGRRGRVLLVDRQSLNRLLEPDAQTPATRRRTTAGDRIARRPGSGNGLKVTGT